MILQFIKDFGLEFWIVLSEMAPYLIFGFIVAGILSVFVSQKLVERHLGGRKIWSVIKATVLGVPLPLCSCGVIPVAASLRRHGAGRGATTAFLLSTPQTGVDSVMVTYSLLGPVFAVFRPLAALVTGIVGGSLVSFLEKNGLKEFPDEILTNTGTTNQTGQNKIAGALKYGFITLPRDIGKSLFVGLVIAGLISALVPDDFLVEVLGGGIVTMLVMMILGIPVYVCATASVPVAAALIMKGVSPGAALVFLLTGPATNAATISTIWKVMGRSVAFIYLGTVAVSSLISGILIDYIFTFDIIPKMDITMDMDLGIFKQMCAVFLLANLAYVMLRKQPKSCGCGDDSCTTPRTEVIEIQGMRCSHCQNTVQNALKEFPGVDSVEVNLSSGKAFIKGTSFDRQAMEDTIVKLGYKVQTSPT